MTKKDYILIAQVFADHKKRYSNRTDAVTNEIIMDMAESLAQENSKFNSYLFIKACGVSSPKCPKCSRYMDDLSTVFVCQNDSCGHNL